MNVFLPTLFKDSVLAIAGDDEVVRLYNCESQKCLCEFKAHENRYLSSYIALKVMALFMLACLIAMFCTSAVEVYF